MTVPVGADGGSEPGLTGSPEAPHDPGSRPRPLPSARDAVLGTCPYLTSAGGSWRTTTPSRDHRCAAVDPPAAQSTDKQRRHCLSADHTHCAIFRAARDARATNLIAGADPVAIELADRRRRPIARTAPILLEPPRLVDQAVQFKLDRGPGQIALIGLMVVAFAVVALSRLAGGAVPVALPSASPSPVAVVPSPSPSPTVAPSPSIEPSVAPSASAAPAYRTTYKVRKGDTLLAIARRYGTSPAKIRALNGMTSSTLRIGQVLKIP
ncbi:MAG TPA: LysM peptidoglycan-binding domain-containing protein [Candidatus Limnocylindrales bacterium]|nr:LysM peptidoglycan-binding domain-containing protein [Candidatus Limnocylindrales bacterium]